MTGSEFERFVCETLKQRGYWALLIPRSQSGAQPFDVLAINTEEVIAVDCKVCSEPRLRLSRIEDNQWLAFERMRARTHAKVGFVWYYDGRTGFIPFESVEAARDRGESSIKLERN